MDARFSLFKQVCLPSLVAQPTDRFGAILLASNHLPDTYKQELINLLAPHPNLRATFEEPLPYNFSIPFTKHLKAFEPASSLVLTCRLDDDDAISDDFTAAALEYLAPHHRGYCLTFPRGLHGRLVDDEPRFSESYSPLVAAGLGFVERMDSGRTVYDLGSHLQIWRRFPTIVDGRFCSHLIMKHPQNDTAVTRRPLRAKVRNWLRSLRRDTKDESFSLDEARDRYPNLSILHRTNWDLPPG